MSSSNVVQLLLSSPLGKNLSPSEASELVAAGTTRSIGRDAALFTTGDQGDALFILVEGSAKVVLGKASTGVTDVATLGPGQIVGELEVMTGSLRVATVVTTDECTFLELSAAALQSMLDENKAPANKLVATIARTLARRLAAVNQRIVEREARPAPAATPSAEPTEIDDDDVIPMEDDDLDVLDKLWG